MTARRVTPIKKKKRAKRDYSAQCDKLCGAIVRARGHCEVLFDGPQHEGPLQWAHGFSRSYRAVRWDLRNGFCLCRAHHFWFTNHPLEWTDWMVEQLGENGYAELRALALAGERPDTQALLVELKAEARAA